jgi:glycerophosphoryl diester phosphodiesterase
MGGGVSCLDIAHRGASLDAPENTLPAFALAVEQGADMIETDLHLLRDGTVALYHDSEIGGRPIGSLSWAELHALAPAIPTLEQALDAVGARIDFNLEIKRGDDADYPGLAERTLGEVKRRGLLARTLFSSFYDSALAELRRLEPTARIGLLVSQRGDVSVPERASRLGAEAVHPERSITSAERVRELHAGGWRVHVFTVDDERDLARLIEWGVDGIFTNAPARLRALLDQRPRR